MQVEGGGGLGTKERNKIPDTEGTSREGTEGSGTGSKAECFSRLFLHFDLRRAPHF